MPELVVPRLAVAPWLRDVGRTYGDDRYRAHLVAAAVSDPGLPGWCGSVGPVGQDVRDHEGGS